MSSYPYTNKLAPSPYPKVGDAHDITIKVYVVKNLTLCQQINLEARLWSVYVHRKSNIEILLVMAPYVPPLLDDTLKGSVDVARVDSPAVRVIFSFLSCSRLRDGRKMWATELDWLYLDEANNKTTVT